MSPLSSNSPGLSGRGRELFRVALCELVYDPTVADWAVFREKYSRDMHYLGSVQLSNIREAKRGPANIERNNLKYKTAVFGT